MGKKTLWSSIGVIVLGAIVYFAYSSLASPTEIISNYKDASDCSVVAQTVINKYGINKNQIAGCQSKTFNLDGQSVDFVHIEYGIANDCPSGCFFSHFCAVVEEENVYPYSSYFINNEEDVLGISQERAEAGYELSSENYGEDKLPGKQHLLTSNPKFTNFKNKEIVHGGDAGYRISEFRWCNN